MSAKQSKTSQTSITAIVAELDMDDCKPREIADLLLALLPTNATGRDPHAKKLLQALDLVKSELSHRAPGPSVPFGTGNEQAALALPTTTMIRIFEFLPHRELVHRVSLVHKKWLGVARMPQLWAQLDHITGLSSFSEAREKFTKSNFLDFDQRSQFASLQSITLPDRIHFDVSDLRQIAKACPRLVELDLGHEYGSGGAHDHHILALPGLFPHLSKVGLDMCNVTNYGIHQFMLAMGERLKAIRIRRVGYFCKYLTNETLVNIAENNICPNLTGFGYMSDYVGYNRFHDGLTETGICALLDACPKLQSLALIGTQNVQPKVVLESILNKGPAGRSLDFLEFHSYWYFHHKNVILTDRSLDDLVFRIRQKVKHCQFSSVGPCLKLYPRVCECGSADGTHKGFCSCE